MTWFKVDDSLHSHPKAMVASLAAIGLWTVAGSWSGDHLTDGFIPDHMIPSLARGQIELAKELCAAGLWKRCKGGYQFHQWHVDADGTVRNPSREEVTSVRAKRAEAGRKGGLASGRTRSKPRSNSEANASVDASRIVEPPSRPVPSRRDGTSLGDLSAGDQSVRANAGEREATRWLNTRYGLTDHESAQVIRETHRRAAEPIKNLVPYLVRMADQGHLADIVGPIQLAAAPPVPRPPVQLPMLQAVPDLPGQARATDPNAAFLEAKAAIARRKRGAS